MPQISNLQWLLLWNADVDFELWKSPNADDDDDDVDVADVDFELWKPPNANFSLSPAVRHDRMRGGRNKFGPMYKRDRARKLQVHPMLQVQLWVLIGDLCSKCHQVWSFVINPPFPNDWHNFKLPPICPTDQVSRLFCTISNSFFFLEGTVTPCRYYTF